MPSPFQGLIGIVSTSSKTAPAQPRISRISLHPVMDLSGAAIGVWPGESPIHSYSAGPGFAEYQLSALKVRCDDDGLGPVLDTQRLEDRRDVDLHGAFG